MPKFVRPCDCAALNGAPPDARLRSRLFNGTAARWQMHVSVVLSECRSEG